VVEGRAGVGVSRGVGVPPAAKLEVTFGGEVGVGRVVGEKDREGVFTGVTVELPRDREGEGEVVTETAGEGEMEGDGVEERVAVPAVGLTAGVRVELIAMVVGLSVNVALEDSVGRTAECVGTMGVREPEAVRV